MQRVAHFHLLFVRILSQISEKNTVMHCRCRPSMRVLLWQPFEQLWLDFGVRFLPCVAF